VAQEIRTKRDMVELDVEILPSPRIAEDAGGKWRLIAHNLCKWQIILEAPFFQNIRQFPYDNMKLYIFS
jgi:hypothetical protein